MKCIGFYIFIASLGWPVLSQSRYLSFDRLTVDQGLSQGQVNTISQDTQGFIWIGTVDGLNRYDGYSVKIFKNEPDMTGGISGNNISALCPGENGLWIGLQDNGLDFLDAKTGLFKNYSSEETNLASNTVKCLFKDSRGYLWIGTSKGLNRLHPSTGEMTTFLADPDDPRSLPDRSIHALFEANGKLYVGTKNGLCMLNTASPDSGFIQIPGVQGQVNAIEAFKDGVWVAGPKGLYRFGPERNLEEIYHKDAGKGLKSNEILAIQKDKWGQTWVGASEGLYLYSETNDLFTRFEHNPADLNSLGSNLVRVIFEDDTGILWLGHFTEGISKYNNIGSGFTSYKIGTTGGVLAFEEDAKGSMWIGTYDDGVFQIVDGEKRAYESDPSDPNALINNLVFDIHLDKDKKLWFATGNGVDLLNETSNGFKHFKHDSDLENINFFTSFFEDVEGRFWVGSFAGLNLLDRRSGQLKRFMHDKDDDASLGSDMVWDVVGDKSGNLWLATIGGGINQYNPDQNVFHRYTSNPENANSLSNDDVYVIYIDDNEHLWIGTVHGLNFFDPETGQFDRYYVQAGFPSDLVYSILQDEQGYLWLGTNTGLARFNPENKSFQNFNTSNGLLYNEFNIGAAHVSDNGLIYFGNVEGYNTFRSHEIRTNTHAPPLVITSCRVDAQETAFKIPDTDDYGLVLNYKDNVLTMEFAALDYVAPEKNQYSYILDGQQREWIESSNNRVARFINLPANDYVFRLKGSNNDGVWSDEIAIPIKVEPAPWMSKWAFLMYILFIIGVVYAFVRAQKRKLAYERWVNEKLRRVDRLKDEFLTNTSHELRTPLNGIIGLVDSLMDGVAGELPTKAQSNLSMVLSSARRLGNLVNDILDFSKLKHHSLELHCRPVDMHALTDVVLTLCKPLADKKEVNLFNQISLDTPPANGDENRLQQIMYNLVDNAVKFTHEGRIEVTAVEEKGNLIIRVSDTGIGIPKEYFGVIFESFEQAESSIHKSHRGAGLGLAITKQLVELHHGRIWVESTQGEGSTFSFTIPVSDGDITSAEHGPDRVSRTARRDLSVLPEKAVQTNVGSGVTILIVDDEPVNRQVLEDQLSMYDYKLIHAESGDEALRIVEASPPALVLLDIMMPKMSGYEVCRIIREQHPMQDLPIIFLTAKDRPTDLVMGFELGANDYLTKPVSKRELISRVKTHLELANINQTLEKKVRERTQALQARNRELETLDDIVKAINREIELKDVMKTLLHQGLALFPHAAKGIVFIWNELRKGFEIVATAGTIWEHVKEVTFTYDEIVERYTRNSEEKDQGVYLIPNPQQEPVSQKFKDFPTPKSMLAMGVAIKEKYVGFMVLMNLKEDNVFDQSDVRRLRRFREHAITAVVKAGILSELQVTNEELRNTQGQLIMQEKMASIGILTAGIAHEIKNPLNFINNFSELCVELTEELKEEWDVLRKGPSEETLAEIQEVVESLEANVKVIHEHGTRANNIVQSMMGLSQEKPGDRQSVDLNQLVDEHANLAYHGRRLKNIQPSVQMKKDLDETVNDLEVVPSSLGRVIINLVNNAYDAVTDKKRRVGEGYEPQLWVSTRSFGTGAEVRIRDNGPGIPQENIENIFNPFFTTKPTGKGNIGLGLSICYDIIVQEHSGDISVNSEPGEYTEFVLYLPGPQSVTRRSNLPYLKKA